MIYFSKLKIRGHPKLIFNYNNGINKEIEIKNLKRT